MNKLTAKLLICITALVISASLMVVSTYAWLTMSGAPEVDGIQIHIGGSNTVLIAADMTQENADGTVSHYPGEFSETLQFSDYASYDYLKDVAGLLPVSTADGIHWILPDYYELQDAQVQSGLAVNGQLKDISAFIVDDSLSAANLQELSDTQNGHYLYLDFWVVAPGADYQLRVSAGDGMGTGGSYVIQVPDPKKQGETFVLETGETAAGGAVRVGFLVNEDTASDSDMYSYTRSDGYSSRYGRLQGRYARQGERTETENNRFTIYEPNGNLHSDGSGDYVITKPLAVASGTIVETNVADRLTVQLENIWKQAAGGQQTMLEQQFVTAIAGKNVSLETENSLRRYFYQDRLQGLLAPFVEQGSFVTQTQALYNASQYGKVSAENENLHLTGNATEDVYITLLQRDVPQRIRMFLWLEGQDTDCVDHMKAAGFSVSLELAGSNDF